jgi:hypothetical protein
MLSGEKKGIELKWTDSNGPFVWKPIEERLELPSCACEISCTKRFESVNHGQDAIITQILQTHRESGK